MVFFRCHLMQTKEIRLKYDQNTFSFEFTNIDFISAHEDTRLLYMLQNYDDAWRNAGDERKAYYFNLPPGEYIFKVKALNASGISKQKKTLQSLLSLLPGGIPGGSIPYWHCCLADYCGRISYSGHES